MMRLAANLGLYLALLTPLGAQAEWSSAPSLPEARWFHAAAADPAGRIHVLGGWVEASPGGQKKGLARYSLLSFDPARGTWERGPEVPDYRLASYGSLATSGRVIESPRPSFYSRAPRHVSPSAAAGRDGRIYWFARYGPLVFDPSGTRWSQPPGPRRHPQRWEGPRPRFWRRNAATAAGPDGRIYWIGGRAKLLEDPRHEELSATVDVYDPARNHWGRIAPMRTPRQEHAAAFSADGRLYVFGGIDHTRSLETDPDWSQAELERQTADWHERLSRSLRSVETYDPAKDAWGERAQLPQAVHSAAAALGADGRIYLVGGSSSADPGPLHVVQVYDPIRDRWSLGPPLRQARLGHAVAIAPDGRLYAIGGSALKPRRGIAATLHEIFYGTRGSSGSLLHSVEVLSTASSGSSARPE